MYLKKLELSGFKSFAKQTTLEFPAKITAIVGPNGSGKSNTKEAIQWVLGEQSMKSLRGKKGEDLIWNGSAELPRMGKASVNLFFDNQDGKAPVEFEEVVLGRKIFRDGLNEYYVNDSPVRLKDVVELVARMGLGETKHNIVGQGEVDRILLSTPRDRKAMLEEALGLRVYQLKKNEASRKLENTENNTKQVEALLREISPHLKFLRSQSNKAEARERLENELSELQRIYFSRELKEIEKERLILSTRLEPLSKKRREVAREVDRLTNDISKSEQDLETESGLRKTDTELAYLESKRREMERELGRLEGKLEIEQERAVQSNKPVWDFHSVQEEFREFIAEVKSILQEEEDLDGARSHLLALVEDLENLVGQLGRGALSHTRKEEFQPNETLRKLEESAVALRSELQKMGQEIEGRRKAEREEVKRYQEIQQKIRELDSLLRAKQDEDRGLTLQIERLGFDEERLKIRETELNKELDEAGIKKEELNDAASNGYENAPVGDLRKKIERLKARLEEIGGIDPLVVKECQEAEARYSFLEKELNDLKQAHTSVKDLIKELEDHIYKDFKDGFSKIKAEFHSYFRIIFGGGKASLQLIKVPLRGGSEELGVETEDFIEGDDLSYEEGIELTVDLPKKRIKGLAMLSGGERALTSIALLFAITAVNPPPFLVLDETDAALDEANSQRYALILKELSKKTQLILVTHNRETMKCADVLYGVTMGEDGASKLLSLKLAEAEVYTNR